MTDLLFNKDFHGAFAEQCHYDNKSKQYCLGQLERLVKDKIVIDLGAGNGIFSFAAALAGAKKVFAIENNQFICVLLKNAVKQEGWSNIIEVCNKDFIEDNLSELYKQADIVVADIISTTLYSNICPKLFLNLKSTYPHIKFIPDNFSYTGKIVEDPLLDEHINWGFKSQKINSALDKIALSIMTVHPMKIHPATHASIDTKDSYNLISYNFDEEKIQKNQLDLPDIKEKQWLEIAAKVDNFEFNYEYIPLHIDFFNNSKKVSLEPENFYHKIKTLK